MSEVRAPRGSRVAQAKATAQRVKIKAQRQRVKAEERFPIITALASRLIEVNLFDSATRLASQVFLTTIPLFFAVAAFAPATVRDHIADSVRVLFGLTGAAQAQLHEVLGSSATTGLRQTTGLIGALMALLSATSLSRALGRVLGRAWQQPKSGARVAAWRWLAWLLVWVAGLVAQAPLRSGFGVGPWLGAVLSFLSGVLMWWWTQHLLLAARIRWLPLLPGAVLTAAAMSAVGLSADVYMPRALNRSLATYGSLGAVLTMLSWLIVICAVLTFTITAGAVLAEEPPLRRHLSR